MEPAKGTGAGAVSSRALAAQPPPLYLPVLPVPIPYSQNTPPLCQMHLIFPVLPSLPQIHQELGKGHEGGEEPQLPM